MLYFLIFFKKHPQARSSVIDRTFLAHGANSNSTLYMAIPKQSDAKIERFSVHCSEMPYLLTIFINCDTVRVLSRAKQDTSPNHIF